MKLVEILILIGITGYSGWVIKKKISDIKNGTGCGCGCSECGRLCSVKEGKNKEKKIKF